MSKWKYKEVTVSGRNDVRKNGCVLEHRLIAEKKLGRSLLKGETVHHIDEDRTNNTPDNLMVFRTQSDHMRFHGNGIAIKNEDGSYVSPKHAKRVSECEWEINRCANCGSLCKRKFCSDRCVGIFHRRAERPSREDLELMIKTMPFVKIGKVFGVSDNGVRKWARSLGLPVNRKQKKEYFSMPL